MKYVIPKTEPLRHGPKPMSAKEVRAWMKRYDLNLTHGAAALGIARITMRNYRDNGAPPIVRLAIWAVENQDA